MTVTDTDQDNPLVSLFFDIGLKIDSLHSAVKERNRLDKLARMSSQPVLYEYTDAVTLSGGATFGVIRLTGPDQGHLWFARSINIFDVTLGLSATAITGSFFLCRSASDMRGRAAANQIMGAEVCDAVEQGVAVATVNNPIVKQYTGESISARLNEEFFLAIVGGTTGHQYSCTFRVMDVEEAAFSQEWAI